MSQKTVYYDFNSVRRSIVTHDHDDEVILHTAQDVEPIIETVKAMREEHAVHGGHRKSQNMTPVAEIPMTVFEQAYREGWLHDQKKWKEWINRPENQVFRITDGRV